MKKLLSVIKILLLISVLLSCSKDDGDPIADSDALLQFTQDSAEVLVPKGSSDVEYTLEYRVAKQSSSDATVTLTVDAVNTNAVYGTDYIIVNQTNVLEAGTLTGTFKIKLLEAGATQTGKSITFKINSPTLNNAIVNQSFLLNMSLVCEISSFVGSFNYVGWWDATGVYNIIESPVQNELLIKNWLKAGIDLKVSYDANHIITFVPQSSSVTYPTTNKYYTVRMSEDLDKISSFDPCTREMKLYVNWYVPGFAEMGDKTETFTGQ